MKKSLLLVLLLLSVPLASSVFAQGPMQLAKPTAADVAKLSKLEKDYKAAKAALAKTPNNVKARRDFATIGTAYGHESMMSPALAPKVKYRQALHIYREVLKINPNQPVAKQESELIISIYKSMKLPIPKD